MAPNFCINLRCNPNPDAGRLLNRQYNPSILLCGGRSAFQGLFWGDGWLALDLLYYHSFLLSLHAKGLSDLSDPPWMQLHA